MAQALTRSRGAAADVKRARMHPPAYAAVFCVDRHTSAELVAFLVCVVARQPGRKEIHAICDDLSAHTKGVDEFLALHPKVHLHYTPAYSSWLNQVEIWFSRIERDVIIRGVFASPVGPRPSHHYGFSCYQPRFS